MSPSKPRQAWVVGLALLVSCLTACAPTRGPLPEPWEYACTWSSEAGDTLQLETDATARLDVSGSLLLESVVSDEILAGDRYSAAANWMVGNGVLYTNEDGSPAVTIVIRTSEGPRFWRLSVQREGEGFRLLTPRQNADDNTRVSFSASDCFDPMLSG
jgi:hypothetical protein